ncbi:MAG: hypothetical protein Q7T04_01450 [Dehalococcoidia bacterium]|nr:hypothetical protein [Dehalococcoidia bacterium]
MLKYVLAVLAIAALASLSCVSRTGEQSVDLGQEFSLALGQGASLKGQQLRVRFLEVVTDSRCPTGATCVWQGEVSCLLEITHLGPSQRKVLTQPGLTKGHWKDSFEDYQVQFTVEPYPEVGRGIEKGDYRLRLVFEKKPALAGGILATFDVNQEKYMVFLTKKTGIEQVFAVQRGESRATIPTGRMLRGSVPYNEPWSWHIDSEMFGMAELTIELCDRTPSQVEANLDYWVDTVQYFCLRSAKLADIQDFR